MKKYLPHVVAAVVVAAILGYAFIYEAGKAPAPAPAAPVSPEQPAPPPSEPPTSPPPDAEPEPYKDLIRVTEPRPNAAVSSPLVVRGEARGNWYFEATFPVTLFDANGKALVQHYATAQGEWMSPDYVPFEAVLEFDAPATETGTLVLYKSNASGLPEHDDQVTISVRFARDPGAQKPPAGECRPTGCSGQVCSDEDVITTCEFRPEYACYQDATCERQADGRCGWTMTSALRSCLEASVTVE